MFLFNGRGGKKDVITSVTKKKGGESEGEGALGTVSAQQSPMQKTEQTLTLKKKI
jgi:hypothetical protein